MKRTRHSPISGFLLGLSLAIAAMPGSGAAEDQAPGKAEKIAFFLADHDHPQGVKQGLYILDPSTEVLTKVAEIPPKNGIISLADFKLSSDGRQIAYGEMKSVDGLHARYTSVAIRDLKPDAEPRRLGRLAGRPFWSRDGKQLLIGQFLEDDKPENRDRHATWRVDSDGDGFHPVRLPLPDGFQLDDWSSDGQWLVGIIRSKLHPDEFDTVLMHPDGTDQRTLLGQSQGFNSQFSPDCQRIAFEDTPNEPKDGKRRKILGVIGLDGKDRRQIYQEPDDGQFDGIAWSPDGKKIVTALSTWAPVDSGLRLTNPRLCVIDVADGRVRFIPHPRATVLGHPRWR